MTTTPIESSRARNFFSSASDVVSCADMRASSIPLSIKNRESQQIVTPQGKIWWK
jgi:hypothetical protein